MAKDYFEKDFNKVKAPWHNNGKPKKPSRISKYKQQRMEEQLVVVQKAMLRGVLIGFLMGTVFGLLAARAISFLIS